MYKNDTHNLRKMWYLCKSKRYYALFHAAIWKTFLKLQIFYLSSHHLLLDVTIAVVNMCVVMVNLSLHQTFPVARFNTLQVSLTKFHLLSNFGEPYGVIMSFPVWTTFSDEQNLLKICYQNIISRCSMHCTMFIFLTYLANWIYC